MFQTSTDRTLHLPGHEEGFASEATYACENPSVSLCCAEKIVSLGSASWRLKNALDENDPAHAEVLTNIKRSFRSEMFTRGGPSIIIQSCRLLYVNFAMIHYPASDHATELMLTLSYQRLQTIQPLSDEELYDKIRRTFPPNQLLPIHKGRSILPLGSMAELESSDLFEDSSVARNDSNGLLNRVKNWPGYTTPVFKGKEEQRALVQQEVAAKFYTNLGIDDTYFRDESQAVICDHIIALFGAKVLAPPGTTTTEGPGATCESRIDTLFLDNLKAQQCSPELENFSRSAGPSPRLLLSPAQMLLSSASGFFPDTPATKDAEAGQTSTACPTRAIFGKARENTLEIYQKATTSNPTPPNQSTPSPDEKLLRQNPEQSPTNTSLQVLESFSSSTNHPQNNFYKTTKGRPCPSALDPGFFTEVPSNTQKSRLRCFVIGKMNLGGSILGFRDVAGGGGI
ncbi:hypothetical protein BT96DRAFT_1006285 [Gymnopus androsaceus JB14]|uniref:NAD-dependent glutamate dehydrogenase N-terminal domain-containing protein n=1 Tax=Gymnopus androsaceus JB14 TaxID=1447944 RepID=A0A6A4GLB7_9AGAR|nr:hypothetical protein BT96DRAFT_1006285 [Gymnopus androsaceus JB14]